MRRAALIWDCPLEQVQWSAGVLSCSDASKGHKPLTLKDIARNDRDNIMTAAEAKIYGLVDEVIVKLEQAPLAAV